jgi:hypothetical protein
VTQVVPVVHVEQLLLHDNATSFWTERSCGTAKSSGVDVVVSQAVAASAHQSNQKRMLRR